MQRSLNRKCTCYPKFCKILTPITLFPGFGLAKTKCLACLKSLCFVFVCFLLFPFNAFITPIYLERKSVDVWLLHCVPMWLLCISCSATSSLSHRPKLLCLPFFCELGKRNHSQSNTVFLLLHIMWFQP